MTTPSFELKAKGRYATSGQRELTRRWNRPVGRLSSRWSSSVWGSVSIPCRSIVEGRRAGSSAGIWPPWHASDKGLFVGCYRLSGGPVGVTTHAANAASMARSRTCGRLYVYNTILERLPQDLQDMASKLGSLIQEEHAMVGQRHLARHRHAAPADQPRIRDGMVGRDTVPTAFPVNPLLKRGLRGKARF